MRLWAVVAVALLVLLGGQAEAKNLYVNNSGSPACSDSTTHANNDAANPWCTLGRAVWGNAVRASAVSGEAAAAGDVVLVTAGTYSAAGQFAVVGSDARFNSAFNPTNSGTAGNPITIQAVGTVNLQLSSSSGATIGCDGVNYITWIGFTLNEQFATPIADTGTTVGHLSTGCVFRWLTITGYLGGHTIGDENHNGVRFDACDSCEVSNTTITNIRLCQGGECTVNPGGGNAVNAACLMTYESDDLLIEHNDFSDCGSGMYIKGPSATRSLRVTIRYNYLHSPFTSGAIMLGSVEDALVYQNLIVSNTEGVRLYTLAPPPNAAFPVDVAVFNNTIYGGTYAINVRGDAHVANHFQNNIIASPGTNVWFSEVYANPGDVTSDRNHYHGFSNFSSFNGTTRNLATFQSAFSLDANSVSSDPLFANVAGGNYRLCTGSGTPHASCSGASPALTTGRAYNNIGGTTGATIPAGAYITGNETIGVEVASSGTSVISGGVHFTGSVRIQ